MYDLYHAPKALGLDGDDGDCSPAWGYLNIPRSSDYGPRVIIQDYDSSDDRQLWTMSDSGEIESVACSGKFVTREDNDAEDCTAGSRLIVRTSNSVVSIFFKQRLCLFVSLSFVLTLFSLY